MRPETEVRPLFTVLASLGVVIGVLFLLSTAVVLLISRTTGVGTQEAATTSPATTSAPADHTPVAATSAAVNVPPAATVTAAESPSVTATARGPASVAAGTTATTGPPVPEI